MFTPHPNLDDEVNGNIVQSEIEGGVFLEDVYKRQLINSGAAAGRELFDIARVDPLRVYVSVPQARCV